MLQILIHSSKTIRTAPASGAVLGIPLFLDQARDLVGRFRNLSSNELASNMQLSSKKSIEVQQLYAEWSTDPDRQSCAIDAFIGDIYSGLQVQTWSDDDRAHAQQRLLILSGLYGALRACDGIMPYRLEMGYKLPDGRSLYEFWADSLTTAIAPTSTHIINLSALEYTRSILPYVDMQIISPKFLTVSSKTHEPTFVTVHTKIARGAFARWLIQERIENVDRIVEFADLGYVYDSHLSTQVQPVFVCQDFGGIGLSVRKL